MVSRLETKKKTKEKTWSSEKKRPIYLQMSEKEFFEELFPFTPNYLSIDKFDIEVTEPLVTTQVTLRPTPLTSPAYNEVETLPKKLWEGSSPATYVFGVTYCGSSLTVL